MKPLTTIQPLKDALPSIHKALIILNSTPNIDSVAAALGLGELLKAKGVEVQVACPVDMRVEFSRLVGVDEVKKKIGNRNLQISFDYSEDKVEKVSYTISDDGKRFNLVVAPKSNATALDPATVAFDYVGAEADATFLIGVNSYQDIGPIYDEERNVIEGSLTVACTLFPVSTYAKHHLDAQGCSSMCELIANLASQLEIPYTADGASNLLFGIESITQGLSTPLATADTFEMVAKLLRAGAIRQPLGQQGVLTQNHMPFIGSEQSSKAQTSDSHVESPMPSASTNPFAAALSKTANQGGTMPAGYSATGELKG